MQTSGCIICDTIAPKVAIGWRAATSGRNPSAIASASVTDTFWNDGFSDFVLDSFSFGTPNYTVPAGRTLRVKLQSNLLSDDYQWVAYDTTAYPSRLSLGSW